MGYPTRIRREKRIILVYQENIRRVKGKKKMWKFHCEINRRVIRIKSWNFLMVQAKGQE